MQEGDFKSFVHKLYFKKVDNGTIIIDELEYETPYGIAGKLLNHFYLNQYLTRLLQERADFIRSYAESNKWKALLQR
jgi:ligand-binding SRPBCC domain-containing protein